MLLQQRQHQQLASCLYSPFPKEAVAAAATAQETPGAAKEPSSPIRQGGPPLLSRHQPRGPWGPQLFQKGII